MNTKKLGDLAEERAVIFLKEKGYDILDRNFCSRYGEIDIVALYREVVVFVEVKAKSGQGFGDPGEMITPKKIQKITKTAELYLSDKNLLGCMWRIDAILIRGKKIDHIESIT